MVDVRLKGDSRETGRFHPRHLHHRQHPLRLHRRRRHRRCHYRCCRCRCRSVIVVLVGNKGVPSNVELTDRQSRVAIVLHEFKPHLDSFKLFALRVQDEHLQSMAR